jgi:hypothetical protein
MPFFMYSEKDVVGEHYQGISQLGLADSVRLSTSIAENGDLATST